MSTPKMAILYPEVEVYETGMLPVSDLHTLYWEQSGNPKGKPAVVLHGGPGGGSCEYYRQFFDPAVYRIIQFDQRGAGKSTPTACLENNTTWDLVADIELLRKHLKVDKWVVFGGSWGSTLSLAYAVTHPSVVTALVLRGIFLLRRKELLWFYQEGASMIFPDAWEQYIAPIPLVERHDLISAYHRRLTGTDEKVKLAAATAWSVWEFTTSRLFVDPKYIAKAADDGIFALTFARIESHYFVNGGFFTHENQILDNVHKLKDIPCVIAQGRYDLVCPMQSAWDLKKALPSAVLEIVNDAGHSAKEDGIIDVLVRACDKFRTL